MTPFIAIFSVVEVPKRTWKKRVETILPAECFRPFFSGCFPQFCNEVAYKNSRPSSSSSSSLLKFVSSLLVLPVDCFLKLSKLAERRSRTLRQRSFLARWRSIVRRILFSRRQSSFLMRAIRRSLAVRAGAKNCLGRVMLVLQVLAVCFRRNFGLGRELT